MRAFDVVRRAPRLLASVLLFSATLSPTNAQIEAVERYHAVVTSADTFVRSGDSTAYYAVTRVRPGDVLVVDGKRQDWLRVVYPRGQRAIVQSRDAEVDATGKIATLVRASHLKALSMSYASAGVRSSWKRLLETPLPVGTRLDVVDRHEGADGRVTWIVAAPAGARGFIEAGAVRVASSAEVGAFEARMAREQTTVATRPVPVSGSQPTPDPVEPATGAEQTETALLEPIAEPPASGPEGSDPIAEVTEIDQSAESTPAPEEAEATPPPPTYADLRSAFEAVMGEETLAAEYSELIGEFERALDRVENPQVNRRLVGRLRQHIEILKLKVDLQQQLRDLQEDPDRPADSSLADRIESHEAASRRYDLVGRLVPSPLYDGRRLPRLFRLMTVNEPFPRSLGYLRPDAAFDLDARVGQVVGIEGAAGLDPTLNVRLVRPTRVDLVQRGQAAANPGG